jgi:hypothetical protein
MLDEGDKGGPLAERIDLWVRGVDQRRRLRIGGQGATVSPQVFEASCAIRPIGPTQEFIQGGEIDWYLRRAKRRAVGVKRLHR